MKILMVADGHGGATHGEAYAKVFKELGHNVSYFTWKEYFKHYPYAEHYETDGNRLKSIYYRAQNKTTFGPAVLKLNRDLIKKCKIEKPDLVFIYRGTHIYANTIKAIKKTGIKVFGYNNDDPFSTVYRPYFWRHFMKAIPQYDHLFYYRFKNKDDYDKLGYENASLLRSSYIKEHNFKIDDVSQSPFKCDVIFVGHFENDGRDKIILDVLNAGIDFKLHGTNWQASEYYNEIKEKLGYEVKGVYGDDYNLALNSPKISLVFLSKINNDTYTRRCFEIPVTGTLMLCEYTDDLAKNLFLENEEAIYFRNSEEVVSQLKKYLADENELNRIAENGRKKVMSTGHEVTDRAKTVLEEFKKLCH